MNPSIKRLKKTLQKTLLKNTLQNRQVKGRRIREFLNRTAMYQKHSRELKDAIRQDIIKGENDEREELRKYLRSQLEKNEKEVAELEWNPKVIAKYAKYKGRTTFFKK